jgi:hypothetical protein
VAADYALSAANAVLRLQAIPVAWFSSHKTPHDGTCRKPSTLQESCVTAQRHLQESKLLAGKLSHSTKIKAHLAR